VNGYPPSQVFALLHSRNPSLLYRGKIIHVVVLLLLIIGSNTIRKDKLQHFSTGLLSIDESQKTTPTSPAVDSTLQTSFKCLPIAK
jgi:hypothetical protein